MGSRMTKYYDDDNIKTSRYHKNEELYKEISKSDLEHYDIKSNATVLGENKNEIDIEKIKKILDTKYKDTAKRQSIRLEEEENVSEEKEITKEYDINIILEKAREKKVDNYEEERLKKLRDTQYDILNNLSLEKENSEDNESDDDDDLKKLINTIALNEKSNSDSSPLDILSDLKGSENTEVLSGLKDEVEEAITSEKTSNFDTKMINSFYTSSNALKTNDFEDEEFDDFSKSIESNNVFLKIVIALIVIVFIVGIVLIIKSLNS